MMKQLSGIVLLSVAFLSGCGEPTHEQCIREAVEDGKNEYGMQLLRGLCNEAEQKRRRIADKQCFSGLAKRYGMADIQYYKNVLASSEEKCDPSVNLLNWTIQQREVEKRFWVAEISQGVLGTAIAAQLRHPLVQQTCLADQI